MNVDFPVGVAHLRAQVVAVDVGQRLQEDHPHPNQRRQGRFLVVMLQTSRRGEIGFLKHVVRIDSAQQPPIHAEIDDPPQPVPLLRKKQG